MGANQQDFRFVIMTGDNFPEKRPKDVNLMPFVLFSEELSTGESSWDIPEQETSTSIQKEKRPWWISHKFIWSRPGMKIYKFSVLYKN